MVFLDKKRRPWKGRLRMRSLFFAGLLFLSGRTSGLGRPLLARKRSALCRDSRNILSCPPCYGRQNIRSRRKLRDVRDAGGISITVTLPSAVKV